MYYCSLAEAQAELNAKDALNNPALLNNIRAVSTRLDVMMSKNARRPYFGPYSETRKFVLRAEDVSTVMQVFFLPISDPLLSYRSVTVGTTAMTSTEAYPISDTPLKGIRITDFNSSWYSNAVRTTSLSYITIAGVWGYHPDYSNAWIEYDTLAAAISTASVTTITVNDADTTDPYGFRPRFSGGQLFQIDSEWLEVIKADYVTNILTVRRGVNGSTAATHSNGASVKVWQVDDPIRRVVARQAGLLYARRGAYQVETIDQVGVISYPQDLLTELRGVIQDYQYV